MQKSKAIKETLETVITNLEKQRDVLQGMMDNVEMRIKKNKEAGNILELKHLTPAEKNEVEKFVKEHVDAEINSENIDKNLSPTTAKKLMPKMKEKV